MLVKRVNPDFKSLSGSECYIRFGNKQAKYISSTRLIASESRTITNSGYHNLFKRHFNAKETTNIGEACAMG
jgi:hypothetical protein